MPTEVLFYDATTVSDGQFVHVALRKWASITAKFKDRNLHYFQN